MTDNKKVTSIKKVNKDSIRGLNFEDKDVLSRESDQRKRLIELRKVTSPHRSSPKMVKIIFKSSDGMKMVETDELRLNEKYVSLKEGCFIPLKSIYATKALP